MKRLDPVLLTLKMDRGAINQEKQAASRKVKEEDFPVEPANRSAALLHLHFSPESKIKVLFSATGWW